MLGVLQDGYGYRTFICVENGGNCVKEYAFDGNSFGQRIQITRTQKTRLCVKTTRDTRKATPLVNCPQVSVKSIWKGVVQSHTVFLTSYNRAQKTKREERVV